MTLPTDAKDRKERPIARGVLDYFPDAVAEVARTSYLGNEQHNPGEEMRWAREKSRDHADCLVRHVMERGTVDSDGIRHSAKAAWRALALLQLEVEADKKAAPVEPDPVEPGPPIQALLDRAVVYPVGAVPPPHAHTAHTYISGPMRGHINYNFGAFDTVTKDLRQGGRGWTAVISPAILEELDPAPSGLSPSDLQRFHARRDLMAILTLQPKRGDSITLLPGWRASTGAVAEAMTARWLGLAAYEVTKMPSGRYFGEYTKIDLDSYAELRAQHGGTK